MNFYERSTDPIGTPAVRSTPTGDLYVSLLAFSDEERTATFNLWIFPMVGWIWWSIPLLVLGSLIAIWPSRRAKTALPSAISGVGEADLAKVNRGAA
jgi:cytochrome c-type biogenesis protein CcmF